MVHVPDVRGTVQWYAGIGFTSARVYEDDGGMSWGAEPRDEAEGSHAETQKR